MKDNKDTEFISKFYDSTQFDKTFIIKLNEQWTDFFSYIAVNKILPLKQIRGFSLDDDRMELYSLGEMPDDSMIQERNPLTVSSTRRNPVLADLFHAVLIYGVQRQ